MLTSTYIEEKSNALRSFANGQLSGYMKKWKATGMIIIVTQDNPRIVEDPVRLREYVKNCLEMEGFTPEGCEEISKWMESL